MWKTQSVIPQGHSTALLFTQYRKEHVETEKRKKKHVPKNLTFLCPDVRPSVVQLTNLITSLHADAHTVTPAPLLLSLYLSTMCYRITVTNQIHPHLLRC